MGAGDALHDLILKYTNSDFKVGCSCRATIEEMNKHDPSWSIENMPSILKKLRAEAKKRHWWAKLALSLPMSSTPLRWMIWKAVEMAQEEGA